MKIKAKYYDRNITIIDFVNTIDNSIRAIYIDEYGNIGACYLSIDNRLVVVDSGYLPKGDNRASGWYDMMEQDEKWMGEDGVKWDEYESEGENEKMV